MATTAPTEVHTSIQEIQVIISRSDVMGDDPRWANGLRVTLSPGDGSDDLAEFEGTLFAHDHMEEFGYVEAAPTENGGAVFAGWIADSDSEADEYPVGCGEWSTIVEAMAAAGLAWVEATS